MSLPTSSSSVLSQESTTTRRRILDLKRRANALKQSGDASSAIALLTQAHEVEFENISSPEDLVDPLPSQLKELALVLKNRGDLAGARDALVKAKQLRTVTPVLPQVVENVENTAANPTDFPTAREVDSGRKEQQPRTKKEMEQKQQKCKQEDEDDNDNDSTNKNNNDDEDDDDDDNRVLGLRQDEQDGSITFSEDEMLDQEMMMEFKLGGIVVPSDQEYQSTVLSCKKAALASKKSGDMSQATAKLRRAKQFEVVRIALSHIDEGLGLRIHEDDFGWIEDLDERESEMLGNLLLNKNNEDDTSIMDLDDLQDMDVDMLKDAIEMGMGVPSVQDIVTQANDKKSQALEQKRVGNIDEAKAALLESKRLQGQADNLDKMLKAMDNGGKEGGDNDSIQMDSLEVLLLGENTRETGKTSSNAQDPKKRNVLPSSFSSKSAEELKQEAVRLRNEKNMTEATKVFRLYKVALKKEADAAENVRRQETVKRIRNEVRIAKQQQRLFIYYQRFVDTAVGMAQLVGWQVYSKRCSDAVKWVEEKTSNTVAISCGKNDNDGVLMRIIEEETIAGIVERGTDPSDERLEVTILDFLNANESKALQKVLGKQAPNKPPCAHTIRVTVIIQVPATKCDTDNKSIELIFESKPSSFAEQEGDELPYQFEKSQYVNLPRGDSRHAKTVLRRMEKRRIQISVHHIPQQDKPKGWFGGKKNLLSEGTISTLLGKVVFELRDLLTKNAIVGDFPLMNTSRAVGGILGLCLRTGIPFNSQKLEISVPTTDMLVPHESISFSLAPE